MRGYDDVEPRFRHWLRLFAGCVGLLCVTFSTAPERIISETKLDMPVNPLGFLERALSLWDPAHFGHLQNQAYGYLFPMGPFYAVADWAGMPDWMAQRLWMGLVLCAAFAGMIYLGRALGIGTPDTRALGALAYALAPHAQALIGVNSSEFLPSAIVPWMLIPLVRGSREGADVRRAAAQSALIFVLCGGINAAAELAVLLIPLLYLLTRKSGPRRRRLLAWWLGCIAAVSFWWLAPLVILGRYIFSFMPFTENAVTTTGVTSLANTLRGAANWLGYLPVDGLPWWPAAFEHSTRPWLILATAAVAALGLVGLMRRSMPERTFLALLTILGTAIMVTGHVSVIANPLAPEVRDLFDGVLSAFRNIHKFDALVRLPLALGLAHLPVLIAWRLRRPLTFVAAALVGATLIPIATVGLAARGSMQEIPPYWRDAAAWLNANTGRQSVLAAPGSRWGEYLWGRPMDEPMQPLLNVRWVSRTIVPWGSPGMTRLLDAIDERIATGRGSRGLSQVLARIGVRYVLVRNDLDKFSIQGAWPARVHQAIEDTPGLKLVKAFGPAVGDPNAGSASNWFNQPYHALEIYEVAEAAPIAATVPAAEPLRVTGGPEALLHLADQGLLQNDRPILIGDEGTAEQIPMADTVVTDTLRRREVAFSDLRFAGSQTLAADEPFRRKAAQHDLLDPEWNSHMAVAELAGLASVTASSSAADITSVPSGRDPARMPYAAVDGDSRTAWWSDGWKGAVGEWLELKFTQPIMLPHVEVTFSKLVGPAVTEVEIELDGGQKLRHPVTATTGSQLIPVPPVVTQRMRITVTKIAWPPRSPVGTRVGIVDLKVPKLLSSRSVAVPLPATKDRELPDYLLTGGTGSAPGCMRGSSIWTCSPELQIRGEDGYGFSRTITSPADSRREAEGLAVLSDPAAAAKATTFPNLYPKIRASSTLVEHGAALGGSAFDGDLKTIWYAGGFDTRPSLTIELEKRTKLNRIRVHYANLLLDPAPMRVLLTAGNETRTGYLDAEGFFRFKALAAKQFRVQFLPAPSQRVQIAELEIPGVVPVGAPDELPIRTVCGAGPVLSVNGAEIPTRIVGGTVDDILQGRPLTFRTCANWGLAEGKNHLAFSVQDPYRVTALRVHAPIEKPRPPVVRTEAKVEKWTPDSRVLTYTAATRSYLVVNENYNAGWIATVAGKRLQPVRLDGWRQAWLVEPADAGRVVITYEPEVAYRAALAAGGALVLLVLLLAAWRGRPAGSRTLPAIPPASVPGRLVPLVAVATGLWVGGIFGVIGVALSYALLAGMRAAPARNPDMAPGVRRWVHAICSPVTGGAFLILAGCSMALGHLLAGGQHLDLAAALRDAVSQMLCLPLLGRLVLALHGEPEPAGPPDDMTTKPLAAELAEPVRSLR
ncbi:alpha-(1-_3)-arabinofuranosyltransferase [Nonomuraea sp. NPDC050310]|uniref:alpha-(1->3)-arabinofuranosyltransferase n=1 Tax=Nonomuraea sp. NPDC050310 TaxID=3154935 RepID=UPI0033C10F4C